jgi:hypothetical protein
VPISSFPEPTRQLDRLGQRWTGTGDAKRGLLLNRIWDIMPNDTQWKVVGFNYSGLDPNVRTNLTQLAAKIKRTLGKALLEVGNCLLSAKKHLDHGQLQAWVQGEFGIHPRTAERYMHAARFAAKRNIVSQLQSTALYALTAPSTPPEVQQAVIELLEQGIRPKHGDVRRLISEHIQGAAKTAHQSTLRPNLAPTKPRFGPGVSAKPNPRPAKITLAIRVRELFEEKRGPASRPIFWAKVKRRNENNFIIVEVQRDPPARA